MNLDQIFKPLSSKKKGKSLYESEVRIQGVKPSLRAVLFQTMIVIDKMSIEYCFDLKFGIKEGSIYFQKEDQTLTLDLPRQDEKKWRNILKNYLNQRGFHQTFKAFKKIGKGNFASVYLVEKHENKTRYAVKAFSKETAYSQENGKQCLIKQIQIMRNLNHKHLMKLEEVFQSENSLYIVFQLLEGGQLHDLIKTKKRFSEVQAKQMVEGLLQGLASMHAQNIMHRDLKPQNILIRHKNTYELVIADFGLAQFSDADEYLFVRCGTPGFVAPEVINIKNMTAKYSPICDIFSLGLIFHIFLFGTSPFRKKTYNQIVAENRECKFRFQGQMYDNVSSQALDLVKKMLRVNPQERITAEQALQHPFFKIQSSNFPLSPQMNPKQSEATTDSPTPKKIKKDSCLQFQFNKQNIMNGKTDTVRGDDPTKVSVFGNSMTPGRVSKISKFSRRI